MLSFVRRPVGAVLALVTVGLLGVVSGAVASSTSASFNGKNSTFSLIAPPGTAPRTVVNTDGLIIKAGCNKNSEAIITATTTATNANLLGHVISGAGITAPIFDDAFTTTSTADLTAGVTGDADASGTVAFERADGHVVTVTYAFDNPPTLNGEAVCTVYGSSISSTGGSHNS